ncbi:MAG TPA: TetR/AcrR family transcriptional regulator [Mesorhizobium sp.]|jgi:AcrR family transcriptional regulator|nr:TetR/AcrR family transcriptional regulator [Mesorhizobium sp.]
MQRRLVEVAFHAFKTRGYNASAVHDLRRDANVTGGAFSHHFPTKKALGLAVLNNRVAAAVEEAWIKPLLSSPTTADGVQTVLAAIIRELREQGSISGCPLNNLALELSGHDADMREAVDVIFKRWQQAVAEKIRADQTIGRLCRLDPETGATFVVAAYSGAMTMAKAAQSTAPLERCADQLATYLAEPAGS